MTDQTIVAVYDTASHAASAVRDLEAANVPAGAISQHAGSSSMTGGATTARTTQPGHERGFWANLFGGEPDDDTAVYDRSITDGSTVVSVRVADSHFDRVSEILEKYDPIDLDQRSAGYGTSAGTIARPLAALRAGNGDTMQLAEEKISVGKRAVSGGTTRIRRYTVETPVEEDVTLRQEKVTMQRRPVTDGRPVTGDFTDRTIEMTETSEEVVVAKTARVIEEISLHKEASERVETVRDTVRRDEVKVEHVAGVDAASLPPAQRKA